MSEGEIKFDPQQPHWDETVCAERSVTMDYMLKVWGDHWPEMLAETVKRNRRVLVLNPQAED